MMTQCTLIAALSLYPLAAVFTPTHGPAPGSDDGNLTRHAAPARRVATETYLVIGIRRLEAPERDAARNDSPDDSRQERDAVFTRLPGNDRPILAMCEFAPGVSTLSP